MPKDVSVGTIGNVASRIIPEIAGTWLVDLRRGCRAVQQVLDEVLPVIICLEQDNQTSACRPFPEWLAKDQALSRRVRSAVRSFVQVSDTGSMIVVRAAFTTPHTHTLLRPGWWSM